MRGRAFAVVAPAAGALLLAGPATVLAHTLSNTYQSRLPLIVYLAGAAIAVGLSFAFVLYADVRADPPVLPAGTRPARVGPLPAPRDRADRLDLGRRPGHRRRHERRRRHDAVPVGLRLGRRGDAVGVRRAGLALDRPVHDDPRPRRGGAAGRRVRRLGRRRVPGGDRALAGDRRASSSSSGSSSSATARGPRTLFIVLVGYTAFTLAMMAQFGRDAWRRDGETFRVWFGLLGRIAPYGLDRRPGRRSRRAAAVRVGPAPARLACRGPRPRRARDGLDPVRRPVPDAALVRRLRRAGRPDQDAPAVRLPRGDRRRRGHRVAARRAQPDRRRADPDRGRLPRRPLLHVPADRRPADRRRPRRPAPAGLGHRRPRLRVLRAVVGVAAARASSGRSSWRRSSAGTCSAPGPATASRRTNPARPAAHPSIGGGRCRWP